MISQPHSLNSVFMKYQELTISLRMTTWLSSSLWMTLQYSTLKNMKVKLISSRQRYVLELLETETHASYSSVRTLISTNWQPNSKSAVQVFQRHHYLLKSSKYILTKYSLKIFIVINNTSVSWALYL